MAQAAAEQKTNSPGADQKQPHEQQHQDPPEIGSLSFARFAGYTKRTLELEKEDARKLQNAPPRHQLARIGEPGLADFRGLMSQAQNLSHGSSHGSPEGRRPAPRIA